MGGGEDEERGRGRAVAGRGRGRAEAEAGDGLLTLVQNAEFAESEHGGRRSCGPVRRLGGRGRLEELVDVPKRDDGAVREAEHDVRK